MNPTAKTKAETCPRCKLDREQATLLYDEPVSEIGTDLLSCPACGIVSLSRFALKETLSEKEMISDALSVDRSKGERGLRGSGTGRGNKHNRVRGQRMERIGEDSPIRVAKKDSSMLIEVCGEAKKRLQDIARERRVDLTDLVERAILSFGYSPGLAKRENRKGASIRCRISATDKASHKKRAKVLGLSLSDFVNRCVWSLVDVY